MRILVTGSSGNVGSKIAETVTQHGTCVGVDLVPGKFTTHLGSIANRMFIDKIVSVKKGGYDMTQLEGGFFSSARKEFPAGTFQVDLAQPLANMAFYCLEPEVGDGFVGWNLMNEYLYSLGIKEHSVVYPVYKYLRILE